MEGPLAIFIGILFLLICFFAFRDSLRKLRFEKKFYADAATNGFLKLDRAEYSSICRSFTNRFAVFEQGKLPSIYGVQTKNTAGWRVYFCNYRFGTGIAEHTHFHELRVFVFERRSEPLMIPHFLIAPAGYALRPHGSFFPSRLLDHYDRMLDFGAYRAFMPEKSARYVASIFTQRMFRGISEQGPEWCVQGHPESFAIWKAKEHEDHGADFDSWYKRTLNIVEAVYAQCADPFTLQPEERQYSSYLEELLFDSPPAASTGAPSERPKRQRAPTMARIGRNEIHQQSARNHWSLEADLQNATVRTYQPSGLRIRKGDSPEAGHTGQREPGSSLIGSPRRSSIISGDDHRAAALVMVCFLTAVANPMQVAQAENGSGHRRLVRKLPGSAAIVGSCRRRVVRIARVQITAAHDAMPRVAESHRECTCAGRTQERSIIRVPGVAAVSGGQDSGRGRAAGRNPSVPAALRCDASTTRGE